MAVELLAKDLTYEIIGSFYTVYNDMGFGFLEQVYVNSLSLELRARGLRVGREVPVEAKYLGQPVGAFRMDLVVEGRVLVEVKSGSMLVPADRRQILNYLRASDLSVGMLLHFGPKPKYERFLSPRLLNKGP